MSRGGDCLLCGHEYDLHTIKSYSTELKIGCTHQSKTSYADECGCNGGFKTVVEISHKEKVSK